MLKPQATLTRQGTMKRWVKSASDALLGRKIVAVRYLNDEELTMLDWDRASIVLVLDNGTSIWPSSDDEGNHAGAMFTTIPELTTIPVI